MLLLMCFNVFSCLCDVMQGEGVAVPSEDDVAADGAAVRDGRGGAPARAQRGDPRARGGHGAGARARRAPAARARRVGRVRGPADALLDRRHPPRPPLPPLPLQTHLHRVSPPHISQFIGYSTSK